MLYITRRLAVALLVALAMTAGMAEAQEGGGLTPSFGNGMLSITGDGFKAGERVALTITINGTRYERNVTANAQGRFDLATGIAIRPGTSVQLDARGDQGTTMAAITSVGGQLPTTGGSTFPAALLAFAGLAIGGAGLVVRRRTAAP